MTHAGRSSAFIEDIHGELSPESIVAIPGVCSTAFRLGMVIITAILALAAIPAHDTLAGDRPAIRDSATADTGPHPMLGYRPQRGMFLLAAPRLEDPRFARTVVLLLEYDETGALGIVINRPTQFPLRDLLADPLPGTRDHHVHYGGPVEPARLVALMRSPDAVEETQHLFGDVHANASLDTVRRALEQGRAVDVRIYAGYAGWIPGQLDAELARGDWIVTPADTESIFEAPPDEVWQELMRRNAGRWVRRDRLESA